MLKRLALPAALAATLMVAACATSAPTSGPAEAPAAPAAPAAAFVPTLNIATTSSWQAEERLLPQRPILALVDGNGSVEKPAGFYMTCNPSNGVNTAHLGKQAARAGQEAKFSLKINKDTIALDGKFQPAGGDMELVFPLTAANVRTLAQATSAVVETDQGETVWGFVTDPAMAAALKAKHVASLKNIRAATDEYLVYCNPK